MKLSILVLSVSLLSGCATGKPVDERKDQVRQCIKEMKTSDDNITDVFEVCRQIYRLKKVKELY